MKINTHPTNVQTSLYTARQTAQASAKYTNTRATRKAHNLRESGERTFEREKPIKKFPNYKKLLEMGYALANYIFCDLYMSLGLTSSIGHHRQRLLQPHHPTTITLIWLCEATRPTQKKNEPNQIKSLPF